MGRWRAREGALPPRDLTPAPADPDQPPPDALTAALFWASACLIPWMAFGILVAWFGGRL